MSRHLAIVLPGREYGSLGPALRLPRLALDQLGATTVEVDYAATPPHRPGAHAVADISAAVAGQVRSLLARAAPQRVTFLAKSLGTVLLAGLPANLPLPDDVDACWLTPIFGQAAVRAGAVAKGWPSLLVAGEADELHVRAAHDEVAGALRAASLVLPRADHLLEVPGDVRATLDGLRALTEAVLSFAGRHRG